MRKRGYWVIALAVAFSTLLVGPLAFSKTLVINEIAWAGSAASSTDEWIELCNVSDEAVDLTGWTIVFGEVVIHLAEVDGATKEVRQVSVELGGFFLLERTDDDTISDIEADLIYAGALSNAGMVLRLIDPNGVEVDTANTGLEGWAAGNASSGDLPYATMERIDPVGLDVPENWRSNNGVIRCGCDANGETLNGTPGAKNSATIVAETVPVVEVLSPLEGEKVRGKLNITWTAIDPDGRPEQLRIDITVSSDGGTTWEPLIEGLANSGTYAWETAAFPEGETYRLKVIATDSDGLSGKGVSPVFNIVGEP